ncbi:hypothetical protein [Rubellimicrobium sp. CFH 75288]|nr:hypothetical protein [Rubellimicrobium sp. CFH 75288]NAZ36034.1 hypothetical protein [Rubellimicrobium sp. CFH 75288]
MSDRLALVLAAAVVAALLVDRWQGWGLGLALARQGARLVEWMAFWR